MGVRLEDSDKNIIVITQSDSSESSKPQEISLDKNNFSRLNYTYILENTQITSNYATTNGFRQTKFDLSVNTLKPELLLDDEYNLDNSKTRILLELKSLYYKTLKYLNYRHIRSKAGRIRESVFFDNEEEFELTYSIDIYIEKYPGLDIFDLEEEVWEATGNEEIIKLANGRQIEVMISILEDEGRKLIDKLYL